MKRALILLIFILGCLTIESKAQKILNKAGYVSDDISEVVVGQDRLGETVGYVITVTSHEGYGGDIQISVGIETDGTVKGIEMLSISETAGRRQRLILKISLKIKRLKNSLIQNQEKKAMIKLMH